MSHMDNFGTNLTSNQIAGVTTTPLNSIPSVAAPFYITLDAENTNGHFEVVYVTSKTATNINHAATSYAHTTAEVVTMDIVSAEVDGFQTGWNPLPGTWSATDANTISVAGLDLTGFIQRGDKIKFTNNGTIKTFYVSTDPAFSTNTVWDVAGEVDLVAGAITLPYYSKMDSPQGFKEGKIYYKASINGSNTLAENTNTKLALNSEIFDPNNNFDSTTNYRYTTPITGYYQFGGMMEPADAQQAMVSAGLILYKNGASYISSSTVPSAAYSGNTYHLELTRLLYLVKGDYLELYGYVDTTDNGGPNAGTPSRFDIQFISI